MCWESVYSVTNKKEQKQEQSPIMLKSDFKKQTLKNVWFVALGKYVIHTYIDNTKCHPFRKGSKAEAFHDVKNTLKEPFVLKCPKR